MLKLILNRHVLCYVLIQYTLTKLNNIMFYLVMIILKPFSLNN